MGWKGAALNNKKRKRMLLTLLGLCALTAGCGREAIPEEIPAEEVEDAGESSQVEEMDYSRITVDEGTTYQTMESFGTSGAWRSQYVGGFTKDAKETGGTKTEPSGITTDARRISRRNRGFTILQRMKMPCGSCIRRWSSGLRR